jgi:SAM-dependent methyltransferase
MTAAEEWARDFFTGTFVELWLQAAPEEQTRQEADFLEKAFGLPAGASLLDVPCGGGRHCLELARRGYRMTGVDLSAEFLAHARAGAAERRLTVAWEHRAMRDLPWEGAFDGAFCLGDSLGGLDDDGHAAFFRAVARALKPGARFVLENGVVAEAILLNLKERPWWSLGDILFLVHNRYDHVQGRLNVDFTYVRGGRVERKAGFFQVYTYRELCRLLEGAGFHHIEGHASTAQEPFRLGAHRLFLVATKEGAGQAAR